MQSSENRWSAWRDKLMACEDPDDFIKEWRKCTAEYNQMSDADLFPLQFEDTGDLAADFMGMWLAMRADLPVADKAKLSGAIDEMIAMLRWIQQCLPDDETELKREVLRCLKRSTRVSEWQRY